MLHVIFILLKATGIQEKLELDEGRREATLHVIFILHKVYVPVVMTWGCKLGIRCLRNVGHMKSSKGLSNVVKM